MFVFVGLGVVFDQVFDVCFFKLDLGVSQNELSDDLLQFYAVNKYEIRVSMPDCYELLVNLGQQHLMALALKMLYKLLDLSLNGIVVIGVNAVGLVADGIENRAQH